MKKGVTVWKGRGTLFSCCALLSLYGLVSCQSILASGQGERKALLPGIVTDGAEISPAAFETAMGQVDKLLPQIPLTKKSAAWTRSARISQWTYANSSTFREINTAQAAAQRARDLKEQGFSVVLLSGAHYRNAHQETQRRDEIMRNARLAVEACHKEGIRVLDHNDFTVFYAEGYEQVLSHPEWVQTDIRSGLPTRWFCPNNPDFVQAVIANLEHFQKETGIDGYMIDEVNFAPNACGCLECRRSFREETGFSLPSFSGSPVLFNMDAPLWRLWRRWQQMATTRFYARVATAIRAIDPDNVQISYSTAFINPIAVEQAADMWTRAQAVQFPGYEGTNVVYPGYRFLVAELNLRRTVATVWGKYSWAQFPSVSQEEREFSAYLAALTGQAPLLSSNSMAQFFTWPHREEVTLPRQPIADIGVISSLASRDTNDSAALIHHEEYTGWCQALSDVGFQYQPIIDRSSSNVELSQFRVIIAPACESMPAELARRLSAFAAAGGMLIMTGSTGMRDGNGYKYPDYSTAPLTSATTLRSVESGGQPRYQKGAIIGGQDFSLSPTPQGRSALGLSERVLIRTGITYSVKTTDANEVRKAIPLATFPDGRPAAIETKVGQGSIVYLAFLPGQASYEPRLQMKQKLEDWREPGAQQIMRSLLHREAEQHTLSRITGKNVVGSVFRSDDGKTAVVHLLNVGGVQHKVGAELSSDAAVPTYPAVGAIEIVLNDVNVTAAEWLAPADAIGAVRDIALHLERAAGSSTLQVPAGALHDYAAIRLQLRN